MQTLTADLGERSYPSTSAARLLHSRTEKAVGGRGFKSHAQPGSAAMLILALEKISWLPLFLRRCFPGMSPVGNKKRSRE